MDYVTEPRRLRRRRRPAPLLLLAYMSLVQLLRSGLSRAARRREARA